MSRSKKKLPSGVAMEAVIVRLGRELWWVRRRKDRKLEADLEDDVGRPVTGNGPADLARQLVLFELGRGVLSASTSQKDEDSLRILLYTFFNGDQP